MMRALAVCAGALALLSSCRPNAHSITVINDSDIARCGEIVEIPVDVVPGLAEGKPVRILGGDSIEVPYQITHDSLLIFPATVGPRSRAHYTILKCAPAPVDTIAWGRLFPERKDDMAWENDRAAYRVYGPALQASGERAFGNDIWTKSVPYRVLEQRMYDDIVRGISFHIDHGNGMDEYAVGPTLGGGTAALIDSAGEIVYPYCYSEYEILDRGPLRFSVRLHYADSTRETRTITLDAGSYLNHTVVRYDGAVPADAKVAPGIVVHAQNPDGYMLGDGYMAYADSTEHTDRDNGVIYVGVVAPMADTTLYRALEQPAGDAVGHILATSAYAPATDYEYWWGSAWSKAGMESPEAWAAELEAFKARLEKPLKYEIK